MKLDLTENEINLIKTALTNESVTYISDAMDKDSVKLMGQEWVNQQIQKSDEMIAIINKIIGKELKVFQMNDCDWCVTDGFAEDVNEWYSNEHGIVNDIDEVRLCDLDKEGMWHWTEDSDDIERLGDADESVSYELVNDQHKRCVQIGDLMRRGDEVYKYVSFRDAILRDLVSNGEYTKPYIISTTEW